MFSFRKKKQDNTLPKDNKLCQKDTKGFFNRLKEQLGRTRINFNNSIFSLIHNHKNIDDELLNDLEIQLIQADIGIETTSHIINNISFKLKHKELLSTNLLKASIKNELLDILCQKEILIEPIISENKKPKVILMVGANGTGKTSTLVKLSKHYQSKGKKVLLAAGDTFRAAAIEQLRAWAEYNKIPIISQHIGADSASVIFDAFKSATARNIDILIADTAGRLHTKTNLMRELSKIVRVIKKIDPIAPHEILLVVDSTTGQNALQQAINFNKAVKLTGIVVTKLDGTSKGGILFSIVNHLKLPVRYIGIGEGINDLSSFDPHQFVEALFE